MKEIVRRLALAIGLFSGLWLSCSSPSELYSVKAVDWSEDKARGSLEEAIQNETKGSLVIKEGPKWSGLFEGIVKTLDESPPSAAWEARRGREYYKDNLFFTANEAPLNELASALGPNNAFTYVQIKSAKSSQYLGVTRRYASDISHYAPLHLAYPGRFMGFLILLCTALLYSLIPWPRHGVEAVRYSRARSSVVPDILGSVLAGLFFCLPILITNENGGGDGIFSEGWIYITAGMWLMALLGVSLWIISAWYEGLLLELKPDGLRYKSILRDELIPLHEIESVGVGRIDNAKLSRFLIILSFFVSWKALGPALLASGPEYGLLLKLQGGKILRFPLKAAIGFPQMMGRLMDKGVPMLETVFEGFEARRAAPELREAFPPPGRGFGHFWATALFAIPLAWLSFVNLPGPALAITASELRDKPYSSSKPKEWAPSPELMEQEDRIQKEMAKLQARMSELEAVAKNGTSEERAKAATESEECLTKLMQLSEEFDSLRKKDGAPD
jgi:hypothetical protein